MRLYENVPVDFFGNEALEGPELKQIVLMKAWQVFPFGNGFVIWKIGTKHVFLADSVADIKEIIDTYGTTTTDDKEKKND